MKPFLKEFIICVLLSALADAVMVTIFRLDTASTLFGDFILLLFYWFVGGEGSNLVIGVLLFTLYYFIVLYLVRNTQGKGFHFLLILWAIVFVTTITLDEWNLVQERITFRQHLRKGAHYGLYSVIVAVVETLMGLLKMRKRLRYNLE